MFWIILYLLAVVIFSYIMIYPKKITDIFHEKLKFKITNNFLTLISFILTLAVFPILTPKIISVLWGTDKAMQKMMEDVLIKHLDISNENGLDPKSLIESITQIRLELKGTPESDAKKWATEFLESRPQIGEKYKELKKLTTSLENNLTRKWLEIQVPALDYFDKQIQELSDGIKGIEIQTREDVISFTTNSLDRKSRLIRNIKFPNNNYMKIEFLTAIVRDGLIEQGMSLIFGQTNMNQSENAFRLNVSHNKEGNYSFEIQHISKRYEEFQITTDNIPTKDGEFMNKLHNCLQVFVSSTARDMK